MKAIFADSYYYIALLSRDDAKHQRAVHLSHEQCLPTITTTWVLTEVADAMALPNQRGCFLALHRQLLEDPTVTIIPASQQLFDAGIELFAKRPDKSWPLTDCISFVVMESYGLTDALTGDHHFEQAGFTALMK